MVVVDDASRQVLGRHGGEQRLGGTQVRQHLRRHGEYARGWLEYGDQHVGARQNVGHSLERLIGQ